jgi:hypothetical protein
MAIEELLEASQRGNLVVFAGAGVSMAAPTSLPSSLEVSQAVVAAIAESALPDSKDLAAIVSQKPCGALG